MSNFSNYKKFENVGIRSSNDTLIVMDSSNNNISLHSSDGGDDNVDTVSIKNIINKKQNEDLNLSSLTGTTINPVITINNNLGDCRIKTNLNVAGNLNINGPAYVGVASTNNAVRIIGSGYGNGAVGISWYENETSAGIGTTSRKAYIYAGTDNSIPQTQATHGNLYLYSSNDINLAPDSNNIHVSGNLNVSGDLLEPLALTFKGDATLPKGGNSKYVQQNSTYSPTHSGAPHYGRFYIEMPVPDNKDVTSYNGNTMLCIGGIVGAPNDHKYFAFAVKNGEHHTEYPSQISDRTHKMIGLIHDTENQGTNTNNPYGAYLNFTGQHRCVPQNIDFYNNIDNYIGLIVYATGDYKTYNMFQEKIHTDKEAITINDSLPIIDLSNKKKQKSVFGIISNKEEEERTFRAGNFHTPIPNINDDKRLYINSVGEGAIWIVNTNGNLENGDYIQASVVIGMGEKQDDDFLHNYTVAKITCNCNFDTSSTKYNCVEFVDPTSGNTYKKAFVGCSYHCG
jgi:hypothetical protein